MNATQKQIVEAVGARGYLEGWTPEQLGARQVMKLIEELDEVANCVSMLKDSDAGAASERLYWAAKLARKAFDAGDCGDMFDFDTVVKEVADCYVVLCVLLHALEQQLGREIDLEALALAKATGDVKRGVR